MAKSTKAERKAHDALEDAARAARRAHKAAADLPKKPAAKLSRVAAEAAAVADTKKKVVRKDPKKIRKRAVKATEAAEATITALRKADRARKADKARKDDKPKVQAASPKTTPKQVKTAGARATKPKQTRTQPRIEKAVTGRASRSSARSAPRRATVTGLDALTVTQLKQRAREAGKTGYSRLRKPQLLALLSS